MRKNVLAIVVFFVLIGCSNKVSVISQNEDKIKEKILIQADSLFITGEIEKSLNLYNKIENKLSSEKDRESIYKMACIYSLKKENDKAFNLINKCVKNDSTQWLLEDPYLFNLTSDRRWSRIEKNQIDKIVKSKGNKISKDRIKLSFRLYVRDQAYFYEKEFFNEKERYAQLKKKINEENLEIVDSLLKKDLSLNIEKHGENLISSVFLVIQHCPDLEVQKNFLNGIENSLDQKNFPKYLYAYLKDRVLMRENKSQIFGTQLLFDQERKSFYFDVDKVQNIEKLDELRNDYGLGSIAEYLQLNGIFWDPNEKKMYPR